MAKEYSIRLRMTPNDAQEIYAIALAEGRSRAHVMTRMIRSGLQRGAFWGRSGARGSISGRPVSLPLPPVLDPEDMPPSMKDAIGWE